MAPTLGKRKRHTREPIRNTRAISEESSESNNEDAQDVFRRHFETHFKPLSNLTKATKVVEKALSGEDGEESEWEGIPEPEGIIRDQILLVLANF
jgi:hypothetical protein